MAKNRINPVSQSTAPDESRPETDLEYRARCQEEFDRHQWQGTAKIEDPERGMIHDIAESTPHIFKRSK